MIKEMGKPEISRVLTTSGIRVEGQAELDKWKAMKARQREIHELLAKGV